MSKFLYFLATFAESGLSVFGVRGNYEAPSYNVLETLSPHVEIRAYPPRTVVETAVKDANEGEAFGRLFRYITGANRGNAAVDVKAAAERRSELIAMTVPVEMMPDAMRFYLPPDVVAKGAPVPTEPGVHIVTVPAETLAVIRFSGAASYEERQRQTEVLRHDLSPGYVASGAPVFLSYDPPFALPFLRRNEVALHVHPAAQ